MPRKSVKVERFNYIIDEDLKGDLNIIPHEIRRWFSSNEITRAISVIQGMTDDRKIVTLKATKDGFLKTAQVELSYLRSPIAIDFSRPFHKYLFNWEEVKAEIVDYTKEGIPKRSDIDNNFALKFIVNPNETKYLRCPITLGNHGVVFELAVYLTGDVQIEIIGGWVYQNAVIKAQNEWLLLRTRSSDYGVWIKFTATNGGAVYIKYVSIYELKLELSELFEYDSTPNVTLDGTTTYTLYVSTPLDEETLLRLSTLIAGDGSNAINVDIYLKTVAGEVLIASLSRIASSLAWYAIYVLANIAKYTDIPFTYFKIVVSGYGTFKRYLLTRYNLIKTERKYNGYISNSASNASTTATVYTLVDNNGKGNFYKQLKANVAINATAGYVKLLINGQEVGTYTSTTTIDLSWFDKPIYKIEAEITGDGTTANEITIEGHEFEGYYLASR